MLSYGIACSNRLRQCAEVVPQGTFSCPNRQFTLSHPAVEHSSLDKTRRCRPQPPDKRVAQHCYPPRDLLLPFGQFTLCPPPRVRRVSQPKIRTHSQSVSNPLKISKADRHTHRLRKNISRSADRFSDSAGSDSAADSADPAGSGSCSACSFSSPRFVCNAILHRKCEKYTCRTCRIAKNLLKLFCVLYS